MTILPQISPHTAAKHVILKRYLDAWFPILGKTQKRLNYIDGFAGPGEYQDGQPGSPVIAIRSALAHIKKGTLPKDIEINFAFTEADPEFYRHLSTQIRSLPIPSSFNVLLRQSEFRDSMESILDSLGQRRQLAPTFAFVDPFGFSGIPFDLMTRILSYPRCEVFINIMIDYVNRFIEHPNEKVVAHLPETFGTNQVFEIPSQRGDRIAALLNLYRSQLRQVAKYVGRFDMRNQRDRKLYSLFFASNSPRGFLKMKEAMWSVDKASGAEFSDADPKGYYRFDLFGFQPLKHQMLRRYRGKHVAAAELDRFVIQETDYLPKHARSILKDMEKAESIIVRCVPGYKRPKFTYKPDKVFLRFPESKL